MKKTILIIEDEIALLDLLRERLEEEKFHILVAGDGKKGLEMALEKKPDLILLDLILPQMDGITVLQNLRLEEAGKNIPVIILTNLSDDEKVKQSMKEGGHDFLVKSNWKLDDLVKKIKGYL